MGALIAVGFLVGAAKGAVNAMASDNEYWSKINDLKQAQKDLTDSYENSVANAAAETEEANKKIQANIADTKLTQAVGLGTSAKNIALQEEIQNIQRAELEIQAAEAKGSAIQGVATSGVRLMRDADGNIMNAGVRRTELASDRSRLLARKQAEYSRFQNIENARANYLQSNLNLAAYQREIAYNGTVLRDAEGNVIGGTGKFGRTYSTYKLSYDQQYRRNQKELNYLTSDEGKFLHDASMVLGFFGSAIGGATAMGSLG